MQNEIDKALLNLREGKIILYPTDTIWGIGCDATNPEAVDKIYSIKQRADQKSMLVLVDSQYMISSYVNIVPSIAWELLESSDEPLTIIYPGAKNLAPNLINQDGSIGIRICNTAFCQKLISRFRKPIVSTSANISGKPNPKTFSDIEETIQDEVDYVVDWERNIYEIKKPSPIIKLGVNNKIQIIRS